MGVGNDQNQSEQKRSRSKSLEIHTQDRTAMQNRSTSVPPQPCMNPAPSVENISAEKKVFEIKCEKIEKVEISIPASKVVTDTKDEKKIGSQPITGVPDAVVEQWRKSIVQGRPMSDSEKKQYRKEAHNWEAEMKNSVLENFVPGMRDSIVHLKRLTDLLIGDRESGASPSYEMVCACMNTLINVCSMCGTKSKEELPENFAGHYELAYQAALDSVEDYLQSHAGRRWSDKGRRRKKWIKELEQALSHHVVYATEIISGNIDMTELRDCTVELVAVEQAEKSEQAEVNEHSEINEHSEMERHSQQSQQQEQQEQMAGQPKCMVAVREHYQRMVQDYSENDEDYTALTTMLDDFLKQNYHAPENRAYYINLYWAIRHTLSCYTKYTKSEKSKNRKALCEKLKKQLDTVQRQMLADGVMYPEETEDHLPDMSEEVEFIAFRNRTTSIPQRIQLSGDKAELQQYLDNPGVKLSTWEKAYLRNRIHICERIEALEKAKRKVIPPACTVYRNGKKLSPDQQVNRETDKFILEDVVQAHFQTHGNSCWSAAFENLFRQKGVFIHQVDLRGFRHSGMTTEDAALLSNDNSYEIDKVRHMVGRVMDDTSLVRVSLGAPKQSASPAEFAANKQTFFNQLKENLRTAIIDEHSDVAINFAGHYRTIVGIEGDTVYFKNSLTRDSKTNKMNINVNKTHHMTIEEIFHAAYSYGGKGGNYVLDLFWLRDMEQRPDPTEEYLDKIDNAMLVKDEYETGDEKKTEYQLIAAVDQTIPAADQTMLGLNMKKAQGLPVNTIAEQWVYIPRVKKHKQK